MRQQRGRKSAANVVALRVDGSPPRIEPPALTHRERALFELNCRSLCAGTLSKKRCASTDRLRAKHSVVATGDQAGQQGPGSAGNVGKGNTDAGNAGDTVAAGPAVSRRSKNLAAQSALAFCQA